MIRTGRGPHSIPSILAAVFAVAAFVPAHARVGGPGVLPAVASGAGASSKDDPDEAPPLMVMADLNRDGIVDIAKVILPAGGGPGFLTVSLGQADGTFKRMSSKPVLGDAPRSIVVGDFNGDGIPDVMVGDDDGSLQLFLGDGAGNLVPAGEIARLDSVVSITVADFNHDGIPDIAVSDWRASSVTVLLGAGDGSFRRAGSFPLRMPGTSPQLSAADFNGDGIPDLAVVYEDDDGYTYEVMLGNGNGTFTYSPDRSWVRDPVSHCAT